MDQSKTAVNILYASNEGYARHLAASLYSLYNSHPNSVRMEVFLLSLGISEESKKKLQNIAAGFNRVLTVVEAGDLRTRFSYEVDTRGFDLSAMARIFAPVLLPDIERVLYLDCDTVVRRSLAPIFHTELNGFMAAMVMEPTVYPQMKFSIGLSESDPYFNSGVILMDLAAWRRENLLNQMLHFYGEHNGSLFACDQDTLNGALKGRILSLSPEYNFFTNYRYFHYQTLTKLCPAYKTVTAEEFSRARKNPAVIHFLGDERPWIAGNHNHYRRYYEEALSHTPWAKAPKERGKRLYMQLWWVFNRISWLCPPLRLSISRRFGMGIIDARAAKKAPPNN